MGVLVVERIKHHKLAEPREILWQRPHRTPQQTTKIPTADKCEVGAGNGFQGCGPHGVSSGSSLEEQNERRGSHRGVHRGQEPPVSQVKLRKVTKHSGIKKKII